MQTVENCRNVTRGRAYGDTAGKGKPMTDGQKPITTIRFPPSMAAMARVTAERDGMTLSAWIRKLVDQETGRRDGRCPACGHEVQP